MEISKFQNSELSCEIETIKVDDNVWFRAKDVATALEYQNTNKALGDHVDDDYKSSRAELARGNDSLGRPKGNEATALWISEPGLYQLIFKSKMEQAKLFTKWVVEEVLPTIRKTGSYVTPALLDKQIELKNETDLHYKVVDFIRTRYPHAIIIAGLGENQDTPRKQIDSKCKGYMKGQPDILILNHHKHYDGLALELKTPNGRGRLSPHQDDVLKKLSNNRYKTMISNDYDDIICTVIEYFRDVRVVCKYCNNCFLSDDSLKSHLIHFHKITV